MESVPPEPVEHPDRVFHDSSEGSACYQVETKTCDCPPYSCKGGKSRLGGPILNPPVGALSQSEDCLFLDLYVPVTAVNTNANLPVIVWIYGGAYLFGAKDHGKANDLQFYDGTGILEVARDLKQGVIFIAGNYRVGGLWLAGRTFHRAIRRPKRRALRSTLGLSVRPGSCCQIWRRQNQRQCMGRKRWSWIHHTPSRRQKWFNIAGTAVQKGGVTERRHPMAMGSKC